MQRVFYLVARHLEVFKQILKKRGVIFCLKIGIVFWLVVVIMFHCSERLLVGGGEDCLTALLLKMKDIIRALTYRGYGRVYLYLKRTPTGEMEVAMAGHHFIGAVDSDRKDGKLKLVSNHESAFLERSNSAVVRAAALREDYKRDTVRYCLAGMDVCLMYLCRGGGVNGYEAADTRCGTEERYLHQRGFHHPTQLHVQEAYEQEDVIAAFVVCYYDVALTFHDMFHACTLYRQQRGTHYDTSPAASHETAEPSTPAVRTQRTYEGYESSYDNCADNDNRKEDENLIDVI